MRPTRPAHPYWMLAPTGLLLAVFFFYPVLYAAKASLYAWDLLTEPSFVGVGHYTYLLRSGELAQIFATTLLISGVVVVGSTAVGLGLALALNRPGRIVAFARGAVFSAYVVSWVSVALLWLWVLDSEAGAVNAALTAVGVPRVDWLGAPSVAPLTIAAITTWKITGYAMVLFLAGLQDVPRELLQAAALDGAGAWQRFRHVTWPLLAPTTAFVVTTSLIASFQVFDVVRVMTQGGPVRSTTVFVYSIYERVFLDLRVGRASAEVVIFFGVLMLLTLLQLRGWRRSEAV